jgi:hypothetical protein
MVPYPVPYSRVECQEDPCGDAEELPQLAQYVRDFVEFISELEDPEHD